MTLTSDQNKALLAELQNPHTKKDAIATLYKLMCSRLLAFAINKLDSWQDSQDLVHDIFAELLIYNKYQEIRSLDKWLFKVLINRLYDKEKSDSIREEYKRQVATLPAANNSGQQDIDLKLDLERCVEQLPELPRRCFELVKVHGLSVEEARKSIRIRSKSFSQYYATACKSIVASLLPYHNQFANNKN